MTPVRCTVVETSAFGRSARRIWSEEDLLALTDFLSINPTAGDLIPETGGFRKLRWARDGKGKRGGGRVIYYFYDVNLPLFLFAAYTKADRADMTPREKAAARSFALAMKALARGREG